MKPLKKLKLTTSEEVKQKAFNQIEARLSKATPPKPAILPNIIGLALIVIVMLFVIAAPSPTVTTDSGITKLYATPFNGPSHSKWYVGVKETTDEKHLAIVQRLLDTKQPIKAPPVVQDIEYSMTVFYADGTEKSYGITSYENRLWDIDTNMYYTFTDSDVWDEELRHILWETTNTDRYLWQPLLLLGYIILKAIISKLYYPRDEYGEKLPRHSTPIQSVVMFLPLLCIVPLFFLKHFFHYGAVFAIVTLTVLLLIWLETKHENASWRKWMFLDTFSVFIWTYIFFGL